MKLFDINYGLKRFSAFIFKTFEHIFVYILTFVVNVSIDDNSRISIDCRSLKLIKEVPEKVFIVVFVLIKHF